jgi:signal transduction histidine kinase
MSRVQRVPLAVFVVGASAAVLLTLAVGIPPGDAAVLLGSTAACSVAVAVLGRLVLSRRRETTLRTQVLVVAGSSVAAVAAGTLVAARAMFISVHDLNALFAVMTIAVAVAVAASFDLAGRFASDAEEVTRLAQLLVDHPRGPVARKAFLTKEMRDLARRLELLSAELDTARERERTLERSRRELVSWVSHDLRSPLASIRALAEALEDGIASDDDDRVRYYRSILRESQRLTDLVDDLFELSRIQAGAVPVSAVAVPVQELVDDALAGVAHRAEVSGVRIDCDIAPIATRLVPAVDVTRALRNLLDNAVRHTVAGGSILLSGQADGATVVLSVRDECGGIPDADLGRVFETAFRGDTARGRDGGGGGLGLAIARGLVESHAGEIDVRNHARGCVFRIRIPGAETPRARNITD